MKNEDLGQFLFVTRLVVNTYKCVLLFILIYVINSRRIVLYVIDPISKSMMIQIVSI